MIYSLPCLKTQLSIIYKRSGFEDLLKKWTNRDDIPGIMSDIYDGKIWKTFPSNLNNDRSRRQSPQAKKEVNSRDARDVEDILKVLVLPANEIYGQLQWLSSIANKA